jgi:hypothetical protein
MPSAAARASSASRFNDAGRSVARMSPIVIRAASTSRRSVSSRGIVAGSNGSMTIDAAC